MALTAGGGNPQPLAQAWHRIGAVANRAFDVFLSNVVADTNVHFGFAD